MSDVLVAVVAVLERHPYLAWAGIILVGVAWFLFNAWWDSRNQAKHDEATRRVKRTLGRWK